MADAAGMHSNPNFLAAGFGNVPFLHPQTAPCLRNDHGAHLQHDRIMVKARSDCYPERTSRRLILSGSLLPRQSWGVPVSESSELLFMDGNAMYPIVVMAHCATPD